jgi:hypothetical protein
MPRWWWDDEDVGASSPAGESVYEQRFKDPSHDERRTHLGARAADGAGQLDCSRVGGWRPLGEFLWNRWRP